MPVQQNVQVWQRLFGTEAGGLQVKSAGERMIGKWGEMEPGMLGGGKRWDG